jgi:hypothetical protein
MKNILLIITILLLSPWGRGQGVGEQHAHTPTSPPLSRGDLSDTTVSVDAWQQGILQQIQQNEATIKQLQEQNIYLRGVYNAADISKSNGLDSIKIKINGDQK